MALAAVLFCLHPLCLPAEAHAPDTSSPFKVVDVVIGAGTHDALHAKQLVNTATNESATVIWESGGRVEALHLLSKQRPASVRDVLSGHGDNATYVRLNPHWKGCLLLPWANRIANGTYTFPRGAAGKTHYLPLNEVTPPHPPYTGRMDALHGFLCNVTLDVVGSFTSADEATLVLAHRFNGSEPGYPFEVNVTINYTLTVSQGFRITIQATNTMAMDALPFYVGWHPYFNVEDVSASFLVLDNCSKTWNHVTMPAGAPQYGTLIPTGTTTPETRFSGAKAIGGNATNPTYLDDEFKATASPFASGAGLPGSLSPDVAECAIMRHRIIDPVRSDAMVLFADPQFRLFHVFTGSRSLWGDSAIAFEPMSAMADGYNNGDHLSILSAGETAVYSFGIAMATL